MTPSRYPNENKYFAVEFRRTLEKPLPERAESKSAVDDD